MQSLAEQFGNWEQQAAALAAPPPPPAAAAAAPMSLAEQFGDWESKAAAVTSMQGTFLFCLSLLFSLFCLCWLFRWLSSSVIGSQRRRRCRQYQVRLAT
jgi:hypothetical protein